jgi:hypothetical protein
VLLHGLDANREIIRDLLIREPCGNECSDLPLPLGCVLLLRWCGQAANEFLDGIFHV